MDKKIMIGILTKKSGQTVLIGIRMEQERKNWRSIGKKRGMHWEDIDEDISIEGLLAGKPSGESQESFKKWLAKRSE